MAIEVKLARDVSSGDTKHLKSFAHSEMMPPRTDLSSAGAAILAALEVMQPAPSHAKATAEHRSPSRAPAAEPRGEVAGAGGSALDLYEPLLRRLLEASPVLERRSALVDQALEVWARPGFETFICRSRLRFEPFPYQLEAAARVLRHMQGRAILADEVGLGKTIEAGIVLSELRLRGLAGRVLVLAPAGLVGQWCEELERKFGLPCVIADRRFEPPTGGGLHPIAVASLAAARRDGLGAKLTAPTWDLVIADEAHRLKNARSASARLVRSLR
ncbi:MAG: SNF2-related protein, partial [Actinomycetota bacterium]|nr:SNF2-related protein [Actinomycetota bacterium]